MDHAGGGKFATPCSRGSGHQKLDRQLRFLPSIAAVSLEVGHRNVTCAVDHPNDVDAVRQWQKKHYETPERKAAQTRHQLVARPPHQRLSRQPIELVVQQCQKPVGIGNAVISDERPNFRQVRKGQGPPVNLRHGYAGLSDLPDSARRLARTRRPSALTSAIRSGADGPLSRPL